MQATKNLATWASATYTQEAGDTDWSKYQLSVQATPKQYSIVTAATTATSLSTYDGYDILSGSGLLLSTDGSSLISGTAGVVTTTAPTFPAPTKDATQSSTTNTNFVTATTIGTPYFVKPDGTKVWRVVGTTLTEYTLSTPWNLTTAVANGRTISSFGNFGFCFDPYGTVIYILGSGGQLSYRALGAAWDITTSGSAQTGSALNAIASTCRQLRISPDGMFLIAGSSSAAGTTSPNNAIFTFSFTQAFNPNAVTVTATYQSPALSSGATGYMNFDVTPDGKTFVIVRSDGAASPVLSVLVYAVTTPWSMATGNFTQLGSTFLPTMADFTGLSATAPLGCFLASNGTRLNILFGATTSYNSYVVDLNTKYNVNISSFSLGAAPVAAYRQLPRVYVDMESAANKINLFNKQLDFVSSTTTQAVVGADGAGIFTTGSQLLLNETTLVTTSNVTQGTAGGLAAQTWWGPTGYVSYSGKYLAVLGGGNTRAIRISSDGSNFYVCSTAGTYQYKLATPWDISTATLFTSLNLTSYGIDFNPDGTKAFIFTGINTLTEYQLKSPWNIATLTATGVTKTGLTTVEAGGRFTPSGTQFYYSAVPSNYTLTVYGLSTPFDITTFGGATNFNSDLNGYYSGQRCNPVLEPSGAFLAMGMYNAYITNEPLLTAFDVLTTQATRSLATAATSLYWPAGTTGSTGAHGLDFSTDGTKFYICASGGNTVYQLNVRTKALTQYTCTFPTQASAPTTVFQPDGGVEATLTGSIVGGNISITSPEVIRSGRAVAMKVVSPQAGADMTNLTLNLWKT